MEKILIFVLIVTASGIKFEGRFTNHDWPVIGMALTCEVTSVDFSDNSTHITGFLGTHWYGNTNDDVKVIRFGEYCPQFNLKIIPKGFQKTFPNLVGILFVFCEVEALNGDELNDFPNLEYFVLTHSNVTRIPPNFFAHNLNLRLISIGMSPIEHVGEGLLDNLRNLDTTHFYNTKCIDKYAYTPVATAELIEVLYKNCTDIAPQCKRYKNLEEYVCGREDGIKNGIGRFVTKFDELKTALLKLETRMTELLSKP
jgi:hypothetical protein